MEGLQAAILRVKLRHLEAWTEARRRHAARYDQLLAGSAVCTPPIMDYARHVYHVYAIRSRERDRLRQQLADAGVETTVNYPVPLHLQPAFSDLGYKLGDFPNAEKLAAEQISLPIYAELTQREIDQVCAVITTR
jgi:dTDP-4-amino-4,6-dideoxygalactose transaminase